MPVRFAAAARRLVSRGIVSYQYIKQHRKTGASHPAPQWRRGTSAKFVCIPPCKTGFVFGAPRKRAAKNTGGARRNSHHVESVGVAEHAEPSFRQGRRLRKRRRGRGKADKKLFTRIKILWNPEKSNGIPRFFKKKMQHHVFQAGTHAAGCNDGVPAVESPPPRPDVTAAGPHGVAAASRRRVATVTAWCGGGVPAVAK